MDNTALLPYPIFRNGKNYTGHAPKISRSPMLTQICDRQLQKILAAYPKAVFIPLGSRLSGSFRGFLILRGSTDTGSGSWRKTWRPSTASWRKP